LPGQRTNPATSKATATPTRLAAYPMPGATSTPAPKSTKPGPGPLIPETGTLTYTTFLPIIARPVGPKGTAGIYFYFGSTTSTIAYSNELAMGVQWGYQWNFVFTTTYKPFPGSNQTVYELPYQVVNQIRSKPDRVWDVFIEGCPGNPDPYSGNDTYRNSQSVQAARRACVADVAHTRPGMYWLIWNEPDDAGQDYLTPTLAVQYFTEISNTILTADPSARLVFGNVGSRYFGENPPPPYNGNGICATYCGVNWLSAFITAFMTLTNGATPYNAISGYGFHAYGHNEAPGDCAPPVLISTTVTH